MDTVRLLGIQIVAGAVGWRILQKDSVGEVSRLLRAVRDVTSVAVSRGSTYVTGDHSRVCKAVPNNYWDQHPWAKVTSVWSFHPSHQPPPRRAPGVSVWNCTSKQTVRASGFPALLEFACESWPQKSGSISVWPLNFVIGNMNLVGAHKTFYVLLMTSICSPERQHFEVNVIYFVWPLRRIKNDQYEGKSLSSFSSS